MRPVPAGGEWVRVTRESGAEATGRLSAMGGDTLLLTAPGGDSTVMAVVSRERVEVRRSHREAWSGRGALAGVALGVVASLFQSRGSPASGNTKSAEVAVVGGAAGAVAGGFLGFVLAPHRWQPLRAVPASPTRSIPLQPPPPVDTSAASAPDAAPADTSAPPAAVAPVPPPAGSATMAPPLSPPAQADSAAAPVTLPPPAPPLPSTPPPAPAAPPAAPPPSPRRS